MKKVEYLIKKFIYKIFDLLFKNNEVSLPLEKDKIKNILILRYDAIGDMVVTIPAIRELKKILPNSNIDILASSRNHQIIRPEPSIRNVYVLKNSLISIFKQLLNIRKNKYNLIISLVLNKTTKAGLIANLVSYNKDSYKVSILHKKRKELYSTMFNIQVSLTDYRKKETMLLMQCLLVNKLFQNELNENEIDYSIKLDDNSKIRAVEITKDIKPFILFNISSGNSFRTFSTNKNIEILKEILNNENQYNYLLAYAPDDQEKADKIYQAVNTKNLIKMPPVNLMEISSVISESELIFTPDTSIVHIAAALNKPIFLVYSLMASHAEEWLPYKANYDYIVTEKVEPIENVPTKLVTSNFSKFKNSVLSNESSI